jgi:hypothetical protein
MGHIDELELTKVDSGWQSILADIGEAPPLNAMLDAGAFGHTRQRRLGLRVPANCWALLSGYPTSVYAVAVELSSTGVVLKFVGRRSRLLFRPEQRFGLDLFVPAVSLPVHVAVRPVRRILDLEAFEIVQSSAVDRLTLAEYLDHLMDGSASREAVHFARRSAS